jgi:hypothetical protein
MFDCTDMQKGANTGLVWNTFCGIADADIHCGACQQSHFRMANLIRFAARHDQAERLKWPLAQQIAKRLDGHDAVILVVGRRAVEQGLFPVLLVHLLALPLHECAFGNVLRGVAASGGLFGGVGLGLSPLLFRRDRRGFFRRHDNSFAKVRVEHSRIVAILNRDNALRLCAVRAAKDHAVRFYAVSEDFAPAMATDRRQHVDCAFKAIECVLFIFIDDTESFIVIVSALAANRHD